MILAKLQRCGICKTWADEEPTQLDIMSFHPGEGLDMQYTGRQSEPWLALAATVLCLPCCSNLFSIC